MTDHNPDCICCTHGPEAALAHRQAIRAKFPHMVIGLPDFAYSVGLWNHNLPELIVHGMGGRSATPIINQVAAMLLHTDEVPEDGAVNNDLFNLPMRFHRVGEETIRDMMCQTVDAERAISAHPYALQIVWTDREGRFPDDPAFSPEFHQHILA